jgi:hypothetical protein
VYNLREHLSEFHFFFTQNFIEHCTFEQGLTYIPCQPECCLVNTATSMTSLYEDESSVNLKYLWNCRISWTIWCADPWLISRCAAVSFTVTPRFSFTMASTAAVALDSLLGVPDEVEESVTQQIPFINFLVHSYTCCSDRHASTYWTFIRRWISGGF